MKLRPSIAGLMGAFGATLIARERSLKDDRTSLLSPAVLEDFKWSQHKRCDKCTNQCLLTVNTFSYGESFVAGNRCDRVLVLISRIKKKFQICMIINIEEPLI